MRTFPLTYLASLPLRYAGDCTLLGVSADHQIYVEEIYGEQGWIAQHQIDMERGIIASLDEESEARTLLDPLPSDVIQPQSCWNTMKLNYAGPRWRGLREPERLLEMLRPISTADKIEVVKLLGLSLPPPMLLGVAESYVLSEACVLPPDVFFVCRRVRLAIALETVKVDEEGLPYDYDTLAIHTAHFYDRAADSEPALLDALTTLPGARLRNPMDCIVHDDYLFVSDSARGDSQTPSQVHVWRIEIPDDARHTPSEEERLYG
ncbi:MAG: hypothetical protein CUN53_09220 [Phototrophicales bacterium]|nr:MAG: hypothetical protein CUN53_09220 [Phototrophicales bacterium]